MNHTGPTNAEDLVELLLALHINYAGTKDHDREIAEAVSDYWNYLEAVEPEPPYDDDPPTRRESDIASRAHAGNMLKDPTI